MPANKPRKILFISHDATMTGAPILLLRLANELAKTKEFEISFLLIEDGVLKEKFASTGPTYLWNLPSSRILFIRVIDRILLKLGFTRYTRQDVNKRNIFSLLTDMDFIIANTVISARIVKDFPKTFRNIIFYIHELSIVTEIFSDKDTMKFINEVAFKVLAPCIYLKDFLVNKYAFDESKINLLKYFIPKDKMPVNNLTVPFVERSDFLVGACGSLTARKGYDIFVNIVQTIIRERNSTNIHFMWLGADTNSIENKVFINDLKKCGIIQYVTIIPSSDNIHEYIKQLNVFLLTSREDAYPLVVLEAALYSIPSICFKDSGGIPEFIEDDAGIVVDYLDINAYCDAILFLKEDEQACVRLGRRAKEKVAYYSDANNIVQEFMSCLE